MSAFPANSWIISRREDLVWFQGSVVTGLALLAVFLLLPALDASNYAPAHPAVIALFLWGVLFDATHVWATYARSYLAPDDASRSTLPGPWSWSIVAIGPLVALVDHAFFAQGPSLVGQAGVPFRAFLVLAYFWGYWHLVRQHYGFLVLYRRRAGAASAWGGRLEAAILWVGCLYPYLRFSLTDAYARTNLIPAAPAAVANAERVILDAAFAILMATAIGLLVSGRVERFKLGPRHLLLAIVVGFHWLVFAMLDNLLAITATLTIFHNLQYHRIVWQYERGLGRTPSGGLAAYLALGVLLGIVWYGPRTLGVAASDSDLVRNLLLGLGWGIAFHHYYVDGRIWRVRRTASVARALDAGATS